MSSRSWRLRIQDILSSVVDIQQRVSGMTFENFENNLMVAKACLYDFVIIGEASRNVPLEIQLRYPQIP